MSEVQVGEVDGVPAFWVDTGRPTLSAALVFRQGMVDESLPTTGWTHVLEHLALHGRGGGPLHVNGAVSLLHTRFDAHGPADRVGAVLAEVTRWLADPDFAELAREQSVLRAEAAMRGGNEVSLALLQRYGAKGPGLSTYAEPGLSRATPDALRELAATTFVAGNAVLVLDGPPPPTLTLSLPAGKLNPAPPAVPCADTLPAAYLIGAGITLSGVVPRSVGATYLPHVLREVLTDQFRERDGGAYAPWSRYEPVDDEQALVVCGSDANAELLRTIAASGREQVQRLAAGDLPESVVPDIRDQIVQQVTDPYALVTLAYRAATDHLRGLPPLSLEEAVAEVEEVTTADVVTEAVRFRDTMLVGIQGQAAWKRDIPMLAMPLDTERVQGSTHRSRNLPADRRTLRVGARRVQICDGREWRSIGVEKVAAMFAYPDGAREIVDSDGWSIKVEPTVWFRGRAAVHQLDVLVPGAKHIPMLERDAARVPRPMSAAARVRHAVGQLRKNPRAMLAVLGTLWLALVVGVTVATGGPPVGGIVVPLVAVSVGINRARATRRARAEMDAPPP